MQQHDAEVGSENRDDVLRITPRVCNGEADSSVQGEKRSLLRSPWALGRDSDVPSFASTVSAGARDVWRSTARDRLG